MIDTLRRHPRYLEHPADRYDFTADKWGILFLNMGGPETVDDVREYLANIFSDPLIIRLPMSWLLQKPLARFIASRRAPKVARRYHEIGGGSPLLKWTLLQADGVEEILKEKYPDIETFVGMRYLRPYIGAELDTALLTGRRHIVLMSLYPQYCLATTGTAVGEVIRWLDDNPEADLTVSLIDGWHDRPEYIALLRERIAGAMAQVDGTPAKLVISAHAIPQKLADSGDPYLEQVRRTAALAGAGYDTILTFQSRTGPVAWVGPDTLETVKTLGRQGVSDLVVLPISFVSDHIETLHEIDIELREAALSSGVQRFVRTESFNDDPKFAAFLAGLVEEKITGKRPAL
ncbi:MAG: ferrochelatase [candidate division Zixibacteria bacterium]|nr:ferrochelatase [candidate division Zixibacteria bacterium]